MYNPKEKIIEIKTDSQHLNNMEQFALPSHIVSEDWPRKSTFFKVIRLITTVELEKGFRFPGDHFRLTPFKIREYSWPC
jgi:hypothetical protein